MPMGDNEYVLLVFMNFCLASFIIRVPTSVSIGMRTRGWSRNSPNGQGFG